MIIVCGEALVDLVPADCEGGAGFRALPGGSPYNVAIGLARLEAPTGFLGRLSTDAFGRILRARLDEEGVDTTHVAIGAEPTALAVVSLDEEGHPDYSFHWEGTADRQLSASDLPADLTEVEALHVGSVSLVLPPAAGAYAALVQREHPHRVVSLDPNIRPSFISDPAGFGLYLDRLVRHAHLVKVSDEDLSIVAPSDDPVEIARGWTANGPSLVVLTRGSAGARIVTGSFEADVPAEHVDVVDTVGAGDAFMAGLLARLRELGALTIGALAEIDEATATDAVRFATTASAITCQRAGANPPSRGELDT